MVIEGLNQNMTNFSRDQEILASNDVDGFRYYLCESCAGYWISARIIVSVYYPFGGNQFHWPEVLIPSRIPYDGRQ